jgi:hypothetical protein
MSLTLRQICLVAAELGPTIDDLEAVMGVEVCYVDPQVEFFGVENSLLAVGTNFIEVVAPIKEDTTAGRYLKRRNGDGGYMVITQVDSAKTQDDCRSRAEKMGIRVAWEMPHDTGNFMQLHPADTGGSFLEIDWDEKNEHQGHWPPAGGDGWKTHIKTDVVSGIRAAELQSPDPAALAERWSALVGAPLRNDASGHLEMSLHNATVRFVQDRDGRGEGLGGIDVEVTDKDHILKSAEERGLKVSDTQVIVCGLRFNLL